jgi:hypothetical protein
MPPAGFEPLIPEGDRLQTHALDRSATGIGSDCYIFYISNIDLIKYVATDGYTVRADRRLLTNLVIVSLGICSIKLLV